MELLIAAVAAGVLLAGGIIAVLWKLVSGAVDNGLDWLVHTFGNERAAAEVEKKRRDRDDGRP